MDQVLLSQPCGVGDDTVDSTRGDGDACGVDGIRGEGVDTDNDAVEVPKMYFSGSTSAVLPVAVVHTGTY